MLELALGQCHWQCSAPPAELSQLTNLRYLMVGSHADEVTAGLPPPGTWSHGLQKLRITCGFVFHNLEALRGMPSLQLLQLCCQTEDCTRAQVAAWDSLLEILATNNSLQQFDIAHRGLDMYFGVSAGLLHLQHSRPGLAISFLDGYRDQDEARQHWESAGQ